MQIKYSTCKLKSVLQIKHEKSCARSMTDDDLVRAMQPGLTAFGPFMFGGKGRHAASAFGNDVLLILWRKMCDCCNLLQ